MERLNKMGGDKMNRRNAILEAVAVATITKTSVRVYRDADGQYQLTDLDRRKECK